MARTRKHDFDSSMGDLLSQVENAPEAPLSPEAQLAPEATQAQLAPQAAPAAVVAAAPVTQAAIAAAACDIVRAAAAAASSGTAPGRRGRKAQGKVVLPPFDYQADPRQVVVCGIDEAGRGPLMGDVVAACVVLDHNSMIPGLNDSKKLTERARDLLAEVIKKQAVAYGIGRASPREIDEYNILGATFLAMCRAYEAMGKTAALALIDGNRIPKALPCLARAVVKGDARVPEIAAASILAKTTRDADLYVLDRQYPEYHFASHKGYPTKEHLELITKLPILPCYRMTFGPVKKILMETGQLGTPQIAERLAPRSRSTDKDPRSLSELARAHTLIAEGDLLLMPDE